MIWEVSCRYFLNPLKQSSTSKTLNPNVCQPCRIVGILRSWGLAGVGEQANWIYSIDVLETHDVASILIGWLPSTFGVLFLIAVPFEATCDMAECFSRRRSCTEDLSWFAQLLLLSTLRFSLSIDPFYVVYTVPWSRNLNQRASRRGVGWRIDLNFRCSDRCWNRADRLAAADVISGYPCTMEQMLVSPNFGSLSFKTEALNSHVVGRMETTTTWFT